MIRLPFGRSCVRAFARSGGVTAGDTGFCGAGSAACSFSYRGKNAEFPRSSLVMISTLSCFFIGLTDRSRSAQIGEEDLSNELLVGKGCFGAAVERVDIGIVNVRVPQVGVAGNDRLEALLGVGLPQDLQRSR